MVDWRSQKNVSSASHRPKTEKEETNDLYEVEDSWAWTNYPRHLSGTSKGSEEMKVTKSLSLICDEVRIQAKTAKIIQTRRQVKIIIINASFLVWTQ